MGAELLARQGTSVGLEVRDDDRFDAAAGQCRDRGQPDRPGADHDGDLAGLEPGGSDIELADCESVRQRDGVIRGAAGDGAGDRFSHYQQFGETPWGVRVLADDMGAVGATVDQPDGDRRGSATHGELIAAAGPVTDDLADELVAQHDVTVRVIERSAGRIVETEFGVVHEVDVGRADRGTEHPQEKLAGTRYGIRDLADLELTGPEDNCAHRLPIL